MKSLKKYLSCISVLLLVSCHSELDLEDYKKENGKDLLTLNSLVRDGSRVQVKATSTYFFSDIHNEPDYVDNLDIVLDINGEKTEKLTYDSSTHLYASTFIPEQGDRVSLSTVYKGQQVTSTDVIPRSVGIEHVEVERQGPLNIYTNNDYVVTYKITFTDPLEEENYYFFQYDRVVPGYDTSIGVRDFTHELVFQKLADKVRSTLSDWEPYSPYGLPFSDEGIEGKTHTLIIREILQNNNNELARETRMMRKLQIYSISKSYYEYLVSLLITDSSSDSGLAGGLVDLGIAEPVKIHCNISGGLGILGCYSQEEVQLDVFSVVGKF